MNESAERPWAGSDFQLPPLGGPVALCGACRRLGRCRLGLGQEELQADGSVVTHLVCDESNEGGPEVAHGGWTASVLDEVLGHVPLLSSELAVTGELTVIYVKPVPIDRPLVARAWTDAARGAGGMSPANFCWRAPAPCWHEATRSWWCARTTISPGIETGSPSRTPRPPDLLCAQTTGCTVYNTLVVRRTGAAVMSKILVNSADSHVLEPLDLWEQALPPRLAQRAPRVERKDGKETVFVDGQVLRRDPIAFQEAMRPPGAENVQIRLQDLDDQGIQSEAVFPSRGLWIAHMHDRELAAASAAAYNDWCASEINAASPA